jgi:hypothetical protein
LLEKVIAENNGCTSPVHYLMLRTEKVRDGLVTWHASLLEVDAEADRAQRTIQGSIKIRSMMRPAIKNLVCREKMFRYNDVQSCSLSVEYLDQTFFDHDGETLADHDTLP